MQGMWPSSSAHSSCSQGTTPWVVPNIMRQGLQYAHNKMQSQCCRDLAETVGSIAEMAIHHRNNKRECGGTVPLQASLLPVAIDLDLFM